MRQSFVVFTLTLPSSPSEALIARTVRVRTRRDWKFIEGLR